MDAADIAEVVAGFGAATEGAVAAGLNGVEINAGQHSLVRQFCSGLTNRRDDGYGHDRLRFAREVIQAVRAAALELHLSPERRPRRPDPSAHEKPPENTAKAHVSRGENSVLGDRVELPTRGFSVRCSTN